MPPKPPLRILRKAAKPTRAPLKLQPTVTPSSPRPQRPQSTLSKRLVGIGSTAFFTAGAFLFVRDSVVSIDTVKGSSMSPSLSASAHESGEHDRVRIRRGKATRNLRRGDIVTFWKPHKPDEISIKRIVGVEGDIVYPKRGYAVEQSKGLGGKGLGLMDGLQEGREDGAVVVPYGHVWVEGDNWRKSFDSNDFGPISKALIDGKATRVWRGWTRGWKDIEDLREKGRGSVVVEGRGSILPEVFVE